MSHAENMNAAHRRPQPNGPAKHNLTPALIRRAFDLQRANPGWSRRQVGDELSRQIGRWPPFTGAAIGKRLAALEKANRSAGND